MPFRALAFASISRKEPEYAEVLLPMLEIAIGNGYTFQESLLLAANSAPKRHSKTVWTVAVRLLETVSQEWINKVAETVAELLFRLDDERSWGFQEAVNTIKNCDYLRQDLRTQTKETGFFYENTRNIKTSLSVKKLSQFLLNLPLLGCGKIV